MLIIGLSLECAAIGAGASSVNLSIYHPRATLSKRESHLAIAINKGSRGAGFVGYWLRITLNGVVTLKMAAIAGSGSYG